MDILSSLNLQPSQYVNSVGKFLYKNIDGSIDFKKSSNMFDVYFIVLYQIPTELIKHYGLETKVDKDTLDVHEMTININLTTYQDKIRCNVIEQDPDEITLGCKVCNLQRYDDLYQLRDDILRYIKKRLEKRYEGYDFLF